MSQKHNHFNWSGETTSQRHAWASVFEDRTMMVLVDRRLMTIQDWEGSKRGAASGDTWPPSERHLEEDAGSNSPVWLRMGLKKSGSKVQENPKTPWTPGLWLLARKSIQFFCQPPFEDIFDNLWTSENPELFYPDLFNASLNRRLSIYYMIVNCGFCPNANNWFQFWEDYISCNIHQAWT